MEITLKIYTEKEVLLASLIISISLSSIVYFLNNSILMSAGTTKFFQYFQITHQIISVKWNKYF